MSALRRSAGLLGVVVVIAAAPSGVARADEALAPIGQDGPVAAHEGWVAWSAFHRGRFRLMLRAPDGAVRRAPLPAASSPWTVALGPDRRGRVVAVYSRCAGGGCDLRLLPLEGGGEEFLRTASSPDEDEFSVAIWGTTLAFTRSDGECDSLYVKDLSSTRASRRLRTPCLRVPAGHLAVRGRDVVASTRRDVGGNVTEAAVTAFRVGRAPRVLLRRRFSQEPDVFGQVAVDGPDVLTVRTGMRPQHAFVRVPLAGGRATEMPARRELTGSFARARPGELVYVERQNAEGGESCDIFSAVPCRLARTDADPFGPSSRTLTPVLTIAEATAAPAAGAPLVLEGRLTRPVVSAGRVVRREPLAGVAVTLRRRLGDDERFVATAFRGVTDVRGRYAIAVPGSLRGRAWFTAVAATPPVETWAGRGTTG